MQEIVWLLNTLFYPLLILGILSLYRSNFAPVPGIMWWLIVLLNKDALKEGALYKQLWRSKLREDQQVFTKYYLGFHKEITMMCRGLLKDKKQAEDAASDCLFKLINYVRLEEIENVSAWLKKTAYRHCLDIIDKTKRREEKLGNKVIDLPRSQRPEAEQVIAVQEIDQLIRDALSEEEYAIWELHLAGNSSEEIAAKLNMVKKTVDNKKSKTRSKLRLVVKAKMENEQ